jgi:hypothetical protein
MNSPSSVRAVVLRDARNPESKVPATIVRDYPASNLATIEAQWALARERAAQAAGSAPLEHEHWDWRNKADTVEAGHHMLVAVECADDVQGVMAVLRLPRPARMSDGHVVYVDYLEAAPWNLKGSTSMPRYLGVGTVLIADAVRLSLEAGLSGRVGLHSLPQAERFYRDRCRMTQGGPDPDYYDLTYLDYTGQQATDWLTSVGESSCPTRLPKTCSGRPPRPRAGCRCPRGRGSRTCARPSNRAAPSTWT